MPKRINRKKQLRKSRKITDKTKFYCNQFVVVGYCNNGCHYIGIHDHTVDHQADCDCNLQPVLIPFEDEPPCAIITFPPEDNGNKITCLHFVPSFLGAYQYEIVNEQ